MVKQIEHVKDDEFWTRLYDEIKRGLPQRFREILEMTDESISFEYLEGVPEGGFIFTADLFRTCFEPDVVWGCEFGLAGGSLFFSVNCEFGREGGVEEDISVFSRMVVETISRLLAGGVVLKVSSHKDQPYAVEAVDKVGGLMLNMYMYRNESHLPEEGRKIREFKNTEKDVACGNFNPYEHEAFAMPLATRAGHSVEPLTWLEYKQYQDEVEGIESSKPRGKVSKILWSKTFWFVMLQLLILPLYFFNNAVEGTTGRALNFAETASIYPIYYVLPMLQVASILTYFFRKNKYQKQITAVAVTFLLIFSTVVEDSSIIVELPFWLDVYVLIAAALIFGLIVYSIILPIYRLIKKRWYWKMKEKDTFELRNPHLEYQKSSTSNAR